MTFLEKLDALSAGRGLNRHSLAKESGIPYTTIVGLYERGVQNAKLPTIKSIAEFFKVPLDYLLFDKYEKPSDFIPNGLTTEYAADEQRLVRAYRAADPTYKAVAIKLLEDNPAIKEQERLA